MLPAAYVERDIFNIVASREIGACGRRLLVREYVLAANPDQRPEDHMIFTIIAEWAIAGKPLDAVFHLGSFHRVTTI